MRTLVESGNARRSVGVLLTLIPKISILLWTYDYRHVDKMMLQCFHQLVTISKVRKHRNALMFDTIVALSFITFQNESEDDTVRCSCRIGGLLKVLGYLCN